MMVDRGEGEVLHRLDRQLVERAVGIEPAVGDPLQQIADALPPRRQAASIEPSDGGSAPALSSQRSRWAR